MEILVTGATGVLGRPVVRLLRSAGYRVRALSRSGSNDALLRRMGADPVRGSLFDAAELGPAVAGTSAVLHLATRIPPRSRSRAPGAWAENDRIRREGTRNLVDAALAAGVESFVYPGVCFVYADGGDAWVDAATGEVEAGPLLASTLAAEAEVARFAAAGRRGVVLRMGYFYSPEAESTLDTLALARRGAAILAGPGDAYYPSIWVDDAAEAVMAALRAAPAGGGRRAAHPPRAGAHRGRLGGAAVRGAPADVAAEAGRRPRRRFPGAQPARVQRALQGRDGLVTARPRRPRGVAPHRRRAPPAPAAGGVSPGRPNHHLSGESERTRRKLLRRVR